MQNSITFFRYGLQFDLHDISYNLAFEALYI